MGRSYEEDEAFFLTLGAAAEYGLELIDEKNKKNDVEDSLTGEKSNESILFESKLSENIVDSKMIFEGKILNLRVDDVELSDGSFSKREIVEHGGAVAVVALTPEKEILMVRQFRSAIGKEIVEIPAGLIEKDEDPAKTAIRELEEETGYIAEKIEKICSYHPSAGFSDEIIHLYFATDLVEGNMNLDDGEFLEVERYSIDDIDRLISESCDSKTLIGLQYLSSQIKSGNIKL